MIPAYNRKGCATFLSRRESIRGESPTSFPEENTSMPYSGFQPKPPSVTSPGSYPLYWLGDFYRIIMLICDFDFFFWVYNYFSNALLVENAQFFEKIILPFFTFRMNCYAISTAAVAEWSRYRIMAGLVTSSNLVSLKTHCVGEGCTLNLSRAQTSSRWCDVVVRTGVAGSGVVHVT
ncbi:uncharacterized protein TNCV_541871 [Trichonephila clavipes]|nr:uncharacterized protein TNCV_541871 [Trichonephila clavipes]